MLEGKLASLIVTCDGPIKNNADLIDVVFDRVCVYTKMKPITIDIFPNIQSPIVIDSKMKTSIKKSAEAGI